MCERNMSAFTAQNGQGGMSMEENEKNEATQYPEGNLAHLISDGVSRDLRRYPCHFNTENE